MADEEPLDVNSFALSYRRLAEAVSRVVPKEVAPFAHLLEEHLSRDITELPVVAMSVEVFDQPNLQRALDALGSDDMVDVVRIVGIRGEHRMYGVLSLATLTQSQLRLEIGPVDHVERSIDTDRTLTCIDFGLLLIQVAGNPFALLVRSGDERRGTANLSVEVMGPDRQLGAELLGRIRALMGTHNVLRGKVVSLSPSGPFGGSLEARFVERPHLERADVILPEGVLDRIERITVGFSARAASLRAGGRHLRRGLLLHGPPGTGKTHTVRYLMSRLFDRTVFVLSGQGLGAISQTVALARALQPATVVLEDVDLVAEERTTPHAGTNPVLFELLNQMDGVERGRRHRLCPHHQPARPPGTRSRLPPGPHRPRRRGASPGVPPNGGASWSCTPTDYGSMESTGTRSSRGRTGAALRSSAKCSAKPPSRGRQTSPNSLCSTTPPCWPCSLT